MERNILPFIKCSLSQGKRGPGRVCGHFRSFEDVGIGKRIQEARLAAGMTQEDLAAELNLSASAVGTYESGKRRLSESLVGEIATILGVEVDELVGSEGGEL